MPTSRRPNPQGERATREARRLQAAESFAQGRTQAEVARQLGVSRQSVHVWHARFTQGGMDALRSRGPTGPDPKLPAAQLAKVEQALLQGARANKFDTELWILARGAVVLTQLTGARGCQQVMTPGTNRRRSIGAVDLHTGRCLYHVARKAVSATFIAEANSPTLTMPGASGKPTASSACAALHRCWRTPYPTAHPGFRGIWTGLPPRRFSCPRPSRPAFTPA
jgi:transposase